MMMMGEGFCHLPALLGYLHIHAGLHFLPVVEAHTEARLLVACLLLAQIMEYCKGGDLFKNLMMKGGTLDEAWVCKEVCDPLGQQHQQPVQLHNGTACAQQRMSWQQLSCTSDSGIWHAPQIIVPMLRVLVKLHAQTIIHRRAHALLHISLQSCGHPCLACALMPAHAQAMLLQGHQAGEHLPHHGAALQAGRLRAGHQGG